MNGDDTRLTNDLVLANEACKKHCVANVPKFRGGLK